MSAHPASVSATPSAHAQALDAAPVGIALLDGDLHYRYVNRALAEMNGLPADAHLGRRIEDLLPEIDPGALAQLRAIAAGGPPIEDLEVEVADPRRGGDRRVFLLSCRPLAGPGGEPDGLVATVADVTAERGRARYVGALQALAGDLGRARAAAEVAEAVLSTALPTVGANRGAVALVSADGRFLEVVGSRGYVDGELTPGRMRRPLDADDPLAEATRTGETIHLASDAELRRRYPSFVRTRAGRGALAVVGMPSARLPVGGLILAWPSDRAASDADRSFLEACARLSGQALERVRAETVARARAEGIARTLAAVAGALDPVSIARTLLREAMPVAGAQWGAVRVRTADGQATRLLYREGFGPRAPGWEDLPLEARAPSVESIRERREILIPDLAAAADEWGGTIAGFVEDGQRASASVPLVRGDRAIGCLTLGFDEPQPFDEGQLAYVRALAEATSSALERARLSEAERHSRQLLSETLDQLPIGVFVAERVVGLVFQNQEVARILGAPLPLGPMRGVGVRRTDTEGRPLPVDDWPIMRALHRGETVVGHESQIERSDGQLITVRTTARPVLGADGEVRAAVSVFADVTRERAASEAREAFLGVLSHELRTPVTSIYGGSMLLARHRNEVPAALEPVVEDVAAESLRLLRLVEDLLVIARVERGLPVAAREPMLVGHVLRRVLAEEGRRWPAAVFTAGIAPDLPPVLGDPGQVEVVVRNLLGNAAKYGGRNVHVTAVRHEEGVRVSVEDDGPGLDLPPDQLFRLFQRGRSAARRAAGSGIGLFVCRALVEGMGGRIWAERRVEGGTAFTFVLSGEDEDQ